MYFTSFSLQICTHTHTHTHTQTHTNTHTSVSFKGDPWLFKPFVSLYKGFKTHQSVVGYPVSQVRDMENFGGYPVSLFKTAYLLNKVCLNEREKEAM